MIRNTCVCWMTVTGIVALAATSPAMAHVGPGLHVGGFEAGFSHPWLGLDHLLAMVAVGLLAVRAQSARALWLIPAGFVGGMLAGGVAAYAALPVPGVELVIATSVIALGLALAFVPRVAPLPAAALVAVAGLFHGHAHVTEMAGSIVSYVVGMVLATALLHAVGVLGGRALTRLRAEPLMRFAGAAMACGFAVTIFV